MHAILSHSRQRHCCKLPTQRLFRTIGEIKNQARNLVEERAEFPNPVPARNALPQRLSGCKLKSKFAICDFLQHFCGGPKMHLREPAQGIGTILLEDLLGGGFDGV